MKKWAYYNEIDAYAAQWLRNLIKAGHIAQGEVDERSIVDVLPDDLRGFCQVHMFAGVGIWSLALRRAGWPADRPVWTGSCPCQPFSQAGDGLAFADERHLWPAFHHLIKERKPVVVFGEQVASKDADTWIDLVQADLEGLDYAVGAVPFPSAGVGAPHLRDRLYWVADAGCSGLSKQRRGRNKPEGLAEGGVSGGMADTNGGTGGQRCSIDGGRDSGSDAESRSGFGGGVVLDAERPGPTNGLWRAADWLGCTDGKWRPVESRPQPMVDGSAESLGRVRADAIEKIEEEINAATAQSEGGRTAAMRNLLDHLGAEAKRGWPTGRLPGLSEAPFLLSFLRQLQEQGWRIAEGVALPRPEAASGVLRGVRNHKEVTGPSHQRGLDGQLPGEPSNPVHILSSLLARHAQAAWGHAYSTYAEIGFPLAHGARSRVGRLRAYGNAINAAAAEEFIRAHLGA